VHTIKENIKNIKDEKNANFEYDILCIHFDDEKFLKSLFYEFIFIIIGMAVPDEIQRDIDRLKIKEKDLSSSRTNDNNLTEIPDPFRDKYKILDLIGGGENNIGEWYLALNPQNYKIFVINRLQIIYKDKYKHKLVKEKNELLKITHKNLTQFIECYDEEDDYIYFVRRYKEAISLNKYIQIKGKINENEVINIIKQLTEVLIFLTSEEIYVSNISPEFILFDDELERIYLLRWEIKQDRINLKPNDKLGKFSAPEL
jgi:serine/threonine protein kinase